MKKIADLLDLWYDVDPTQKTLIFCSFVEMLELMSVFLNKGGVKHVLYTGKMKTRERDEVIQQFQKSGEKTPRVMLISLKCGGGESGLIGRNRVLIIVGLNLTAANNVIGLDLAWSPASEAQAVDRAHRIVRHLHPFISAYLMTGANTTGHRQAIDHPGLCRAAHSRSVSLVWGRQMS